MELFGPGSKKSNHIVVSPLEPRARGCLRKLDEPELLAADSNMMFSILGGAVTFC